MAELERMSVITWSCGDNISSNISHFEATLYWGKNKVHDKREYAASVEIKLSHDNKSFSLYERLEFGTAQEALSFFSNLKTSTSARNL
ncbi:MAG: hypothetical protein E7B29_01755 [Mixta calida]|nr:hypothetical protein [Mixta calida]